MDKKQRDALPAGHQWRSYPAQFEVRGIPGGSLVELNGYATTYDEPYEMFDMFGPYEEVARAGMFTKTLSEGPDVAFLANHTGLTLARTKSGTLKMDGADATGLPVIATVNTARSDARDLVTAIEDGDVDQMSFAFRVVRQQWSPDYEQRDLLEVNLDRGDVSAVNFGANPMTSIGAQRSFHHARPAQLARIASEVSTGQVSAASADVLSRLLTYLASADDVSQNPLAGLDAPEERDASAYLNVLRMQEQHSRERIA